MKLMLETDSGSGKKRVRGRENKGNLEGGTEEYLEEETPVEIKNFARVGWILDYGLRFQGEKGRADGKKKDNFGWGKTTTSEEELRIDLAKDKEVRVDLTRDAPDKRAGEQRSENQLREPKEKFEGEEE